MFGGEYALFSGRKKLCKKDCLAMEIGGAVFVESARLVEGSQRALLKYAIEVKRPGFKQA